MINKHPLLTIFPKVNHLVEAAQLRGPIAEEDRMACPQVKLLLAEGQEFPHLQLSSLFLYVIFVGKLHRVLLPPRPPFSKRHEGM
jgi:hypothetical protein